MQSLLFLEKMKNAINHIKFWAEDYIAILAPIVLIVLILGGIVGLRYGLGLFPFGPEQEVHAKIQRLYVDVSGDTQSTKSHYMVGTDKGVFEVSNSLWLWIWDADKQYSQLQADKEFKLKVKGNELINILFQEYPRITSVTPIQ
jgi:hypothetical protein